jgi:hypothetical protein
MDESLIQDDEIFQTDLINFDNFQDQFEDPEVVEDFSKFSLDSAITRLFKFIEIESNISLEKLDGTYSKLKQRIQHAIKETQEELAKPRLIQDNADQIAKRKIFVRKRNVKQDEKVENKVV